MYRKQALSFKLQQMPLGAGALEMLVRRCNDIYLGELFENIAAILKETPLVFSKPLTFTLVNVTHLFSNTSYGLFDTPPKKTHPSGVQWLFTFSLDDAGLDYDLSKISSNLLTRINARVWRAGFKKMYLVFGINPNDSRLYGLDFGYQAPYVYNLIGCMTKWYVRKQPMNLEPVAPKERYWYRPLHSAIGQDGVNTWVYSRAIWLNNPGLIAIDNITLESTLYYVEHMPNSARVLQAFNKVHAKLHEKMLDFCFQAVTAFFQNQVNNSKFVPSTDDSLSKLFVALHGQPESYRRAYHYLLGNAVADPNIQEYTKQLFYEGSSLGDTVNVL